jgi:uncharacterized protein DUF1524
VGVAVTSLVAAIAASACSWMLPADSAGQVPPSAEQLLNQLYIAPEDPNAPYSDEIRDAEWGEGWDSRGRGCDTRDVVLESQNRGEIRTRAGCQAECVSEAPCWTSPYDDVPTHDARDLEIDHIVPVGEAARSPVVGSGPAGEAAVPAAIAWSPAEKHKFYEDTKNLIAVTESVNQAKSDGDPAEWRPENRAYWCEYATVYTAAKVRHGLSADEAERDALRELFGECPTSDRK